MSGMWISARPKGWPRHGFEKRGGAIFFGIIAMFTAWLFQVEYQWDGMQRYYLAHYVVSSAGLFQKYLVLHTVDRQGRWHPTVPAEVSPIRMASYPQGAIPFRLSDAALQRGAVRLANPLIPVDKARFAAFLRDWVYEGQTLAELAKPGIWWGLGVMVAGLCLAWPQDRKARDILENGRRVRGAELVTRDGFNRKRKYGIGMGFLTLEPRNLREWVWIKYSHGPMIFIPEEDEPKHFLLMGDTGTGKSALHGGAVTREIDFQLEYWGPGMPIPMLSTGATIWEHLTGNLPAAGPNSPSTGPPGTYDDEQSAVNLMGASSMSVTQTFTAVFPGRNSIGLPVAGFGNMAQLTIQKYLGYISINGNIGGQVNAATGQLIPGTYKPCP